MVSNADIGNYCSIAAFVTIGGMEHAHWWWSTSPRLSTRGITGRTVIGHDVWIGSKASLRSGISVGNGAVIGANSVVLHDVAPYSIVAGAPAREIRTRFTDSQVVALEQSEYSLRSPDEATAILDRLDDSTTEGWAHGQGFNSYAGAQLSPVHRTNR